MKKHIFLNPFFVAYAIFIVVALCVHAAFNYYSWSNEAWERIVAAVTISSYFFTTASLFQSMSDSFDKLFSLNDDSIKVFSNLDNINSIISEMDGENDFAQKQLEEEYEKHTKEMDRIKRKILPLSKVYYTFVALGFLSFLIVVSYETLYSYIYNKLSVFSMFAFLIMIATELWKEKTNNDLVEMKRRKEQLLERYLKDTRNRLTIMLEKNNLGVHNGQDEDAE